jgi:hypothetical protein
MIGMLPAKPAILGKRKPVRVLLFIFKRAVISVFALGAFEGYRVQHVNLYYRYDGRRTMDDGRFDLFRPSSFVPRPS